MNKNKIKTKTDYVIFYNNKKPTVFKSQKRFYDRKGNDTLCIIYSITNGKVFSKLRKKYNDEGLLIERSEYKISDFAGNNKLVLESIGKFVYENGRIKEWSEYDDFGNLLKKTKNEYKITEDGRITEIISIGLNEKDNYREETLYGLNGKKTAYRTYDYKGKIKIGVDYRYDSLGRVNSKVIFNPDMSVKNIECFNYGDNGKIKERFEYDADSVLLYKIDFFFNNKNEQIRFIRNPFNKSYDFFKFITEYNKFGYISRNLRLNEKDEPEKIFKYEYKFYK